MIWWDLTYQFRKKISIIPGKVVADLSDFPVLISLSDADLADHAQKDGDDIAFTAADNTTKLSHEIEYFKSSEGKLLAWVKVPNLLTTKQTVLYVYYGNPGATSQQDGTAVWASNYKAVWHLQDQPAGSPLDIKDSTGNHQATSYNMDTGNQATGQIGDGLTFDGIEEYIDTGYTEDLHSFTVSVWVKGDRPPDNSQNTGPLMKEENFQVCWDHVDPTVRAAASLRIGGPGPEHWHMSSFGGLDHKNWYYLVASYDGETLVTYTNGTLSSSNPAPSGDPDATGRTAFIGKHALTPSYFAGTIDEVRISDSIHSAEWIETEYNNQSSPANFYNIASEETAP